MRRTHDAQRPLIADRAKLDSLPNPYWDRVKHLVRRIPADDPAAIWLSGGAPQIGNVLDDSLIEALRLRTELVRSYSWAVTEPGAVQFVAEHSTGRLIDPIAGTGYWALLLTWLGVRVWASDLDPPQDYEDTNVFHPRVRQHVKVHKADVTEAMNLTKTLGLNGTLFLSWPPFNNDTADRALVAYTGDRLIYIGEGPGGCTGDDAFHERLYKEWEEIDSYPIPQFCGLHDRISVYTRNNNSPVP